MEYRKLFDIKYNNKTFTLFLGKDKRIAFLEKRESGKYFYPTFEDFKVLNNIFNVHNPFIFYSSKKAFFKEKILLAGGILAVVMSVVPMFGIDAEYKVDEEQGIVYVTPTNTNYEYKTFTNTADLDEILGYTSVSREEIMEAINNNPNLSEDYKILVRNLVNKYLEVVPNADLRIFYENIKTLKIIEVPEEKVQEVIEENAVGSYNSYENQISLKDEISLETIYHELAHVIESYCKILDNNVMLLRSSENRALNEAMNTKIVELLTSDSSYYYEKAVLNYLLSFVDYTLEDYNKYGIDELINRLKDKYPNIDYDDLTFRINVFSSWGKYLDAGMSLEADKSLLDELFNLALASINLDGYVYEPFINFVKLLNNNQELKDSYFEQYNNYLLSLNYTDIITLDELNEIGNKYQDFYDVSYYQNELYLTNVYTDEHSNEIIQIVHGNQIETIDAVDAFPNVKSNINKAIRLNYLKYKDIYGTQDFWRKMFEENDLVCEHDYKKISIYLNGSFITEDYVNNLEVMISKDEFGNMVYNLAKKDNPNTKEYLYKANLGDYVNFYNFDDKLELSYVFNDYYLKQAISKGAFPNVILTNKKIIFLTDYTLYVTDEDKYYPIDECYLINDNGKISIPQLDIEIDRELPSNNPINLLEVIKNIESSREDVFLYRYSKYMVNYWINKYLDSYILSEKTNLSR